MSQDLAPNAQQALPRILVIDDLFGRTTARGSNPERSSLCAQLRLIDRTDDARFDPAPQTVREPIAEAVFLRGQRPVMARVGDIVENSVDDIIETVRAGWAPAPNEQSRPWSIVLLDLCFRTGRVTSASDAECAGMPDGRPDDDEPASLFGLRVLAALREAVGDVPIVLLSSIRRESVATELSLLGALDFLPRSGTETCSRLSALIRLHGLVPDSSGLILGHSRAILSALRAARRATASGRNVLLRGETGTGKNLFARFLNREGPPSRRGRLVEVNASGLSGQLYAAELFGHVRGAYTGAGVARAGRVLEASGGDLFLDEVGSMPPDVQAGLLTMLETRRVRPVGAGSAESSVDVRFIFATNEDLEGRVTTGAFREDLLFRMSEFGAVHLPSLRERIEDLTTLLPPLLREAESMTSARSGRSVHADALDLMTRYPWPGNIRELRACVLRAVSDYPGAEFLAPIHLPTAIQAHSKRRAERPGGGPSLGIWSPGGTGLQGRGTLADQMEGALLRAADDVLQLLSRALDATRIHRVGSPHGESSITRAIGLLLGRRVSTTTAADMVKRIRSLVPEVAARYEADPTLEPAMRCADHLRPSRRRSSPDSGQP